MNLLLGEARFYFAQCVFNTACHYAAVDRYSKSKKWRQIVVWVITASTIALFASSIIFWECEWLKCLKVLSLLGTTLTAASLIFEFFNRKDLTEFMFYHKQAAEDYKSLRDNLMDLIRQIKSGELENTEKSLKQYLHDYAIIGKYALQTTYKDYLKAQVSLGLNGKGELFTWSQKEIDRFLPIELKEEA